MFTGIITDVGRIERIDEVDAGRRLAIRCGWPDLDLELGESIAVDGCCLTVVTFDGPVWEAELSQETLDCTSLGERSVGDPVNLERALRLGDRLGGHQVSGHVDGRGVLEAIQPVGDCLRMEFSLPSELLRYFVQKGSVCVDGISLTVNGVHDEAGSFDVMIVPHTQENTSLRAKGPGDAVNIEVDILGKYIERLLGPWTARTP